MQRMFALGSDLCLGVGLSCSSVNLLSSDEEVEFIPPTDPEIIVISSSSDEMSSCEETKKIKKRNVYDKLRRRQKILEEVYNRKSIPNRYLWVEGLTNRTRNRVMVEIFEYREENPAYYSVDLRNGVIVVECPTRVHAYNLRNILLDLSISLFDTEKVREFYVDYAWDGCDLEFDKQKELLGVTEPPKDNLWHNINQAIGRFDCTNLY